MDDKLDQINDKISQNTLCIYDHAEDIIERQETMIDELQRMNSKLSFMVFWMVLPFIMMIILLIALLSGAVSLTQLL